VPILLARVDDRLIHGQVVHGWGRPLRATLFALVSDELSADPERGELYLVAVPDEAQGRVLSVAEALGATFRAETERERTIVLFADVATARRAIEGGFPVAALNLGGLHHAPGKHEILPYVYLSAADRTDLRAIDARGVSVAAQDLPGNPTHGLASLVGPA
jgi:PTS system mannose-specific IIB component/fructoselysine and glucoselysine-specific PTS system IIB component